MKLSHTIEKTISRHFDKKGAHDITHTKRVLKVALSIAKHEKDVDKDVIIASCLLHDIARKKEDASRCKDHAEEGARMAPSILRKIEFPEDKIDAVAYAIRCHRKSKGIRPETIEAKILQDADKIDIFGAIGIARTFAHLATKKGTVIHSDFSRRLVSFKDYDTDSSLEMVRSLLFADRKTFNTRGAWIIVKDRLAFIRKFIQQFEKEWARE
jgi:uncharacterized protein